MYSVRVMYTLCLDLDGLRMDYARAMHIWSLSLCPNTALNIGIGYSRKDVGRLVSFFLCSNVASNIGIGYSRKYVG